MQPYVLTPSAEDDLKNIACYTLKQRGKKQSLQYAGLLEARFLVQKGRSLRSFSERYLQIQVTDANTTISFTFILKDRLWHYHSYA
ncbi:MAG: hypothetical protein ACXW04_11445 [Methylobacter sp.]